MVDMISGGRLILGVGAGYAPEEFAAFGLSVKQRGSRLDEGAALLRPALDGNQRHAPRPVLPRRRRHGGTQAGAAAGSPHLVRRLDRARHQSCGSAGRRLAGRAIGRAVGAVVVREVVPPDARGDGQGAGGDRRVPLRLRRGHHRAGAGGRRGLFHPGLREHVLPLAASRRQAAARRADHRAARREPHHPGRRRYLRSGRSRVSGKSWGWTTSSAASPSPAFPAKRPWHPWTSSPGRSCRRFDEKRPSRRALATGKGPVATDRCVAGRRLRGLNRSPATSWPLPRSRPRAPRNLRRS